MSPERRDALLAAIAKARGWIEGIRLGRFASFAEIAEHEAQGERHIRLLAPLAFLRQGPLTIPQQSDCGPSGSSDSRQNPTLARVRKRTREAPQPRVDDNALQRAI